MKNERAIIVAYADNHVIGDRAAIPWLGRVPADMRRVRELTTGNAIIMGQKTFESLGRPLPKRQNIVLSRDLNLREEFGIDLATSLDEAFSLVKTGRIAFIFGGASVYAQSMDLVDTIYATEIHGEFTGDAFFPEISADKWQAVARQDFPADDENAFPYSFVKYERRKP